MPSLRDMRRRIRSITNTAQITRAMQMVAASKMRKAQQAALTTRPFAQLLYRIQRRATTHAGDFTHPLLEAREVRKRAVILVGTDKGLCGTLNSNLFRLALEFDPATTVFITAGKQAAQFIARTGRALTAEFLHRLAAVRRGASDCRSCPRPVFERRRGSGPGSRDAVHQHIDPATRRGRVFADRRDQRAEDSGRGIRSGPRRRRDRVPL